MDSEKDDAKHPMSMPLRDIYGRNMGEVVGIIFSLDGNIECIGVSESAGRFVSYPGARLLKRESELLIIPEWRAEAQNLAKQKESLKKRERAIDELFRCRDLDPKTFDDMSAEIAAARARCRGLREKVEVRLRELEERTQRVSDFIGISKVQHATAEIDEWAYQVTADFGRSQLETDARELDELRSAIGYLEDIEGDAPLPAPHEPAELLADESEPPAEGLPRAEASIPEREETAIAGKPPLVSLGNYQTAQPEPEPTGVGTLAKQEPLDAKVGIPPVVSDVAPTGGSDRSHQFTALVAPSAPIPSYSLSGIEELRNLFK